MAKKFTYQLRNGKTLELEGDTQPSDDEIEAIAKEQGVELSPVNESPSITKLNIPIKQDESSIFYPKPRDISLQQNEPVETEPEGIISKLWHKATDPLVNLRGTEDSTIRKATDSFAQDHPIIGGGLNFIADMVSGTSSPLNLAIAGTAGGTQLAARAGLPKIAQVMNYGTKGLSAPVIGHGANEMYSGETGPEKAGGLLEVLGGILGMRSKVPQIGKSISQPDIPSELPQLNKSVDPNFNGGMGDPMLAGSNPYPQQLSPPANITLQFNPRGKMGLTKSIQSSKTEGPTITNIKEPTPELIAEAQTKGPDNIFIRNPNPKFIQRMGEYGYQFADVAEDGRYRMVKGKPIQPQILEQDIPSRLGPLADVKKNSVAAEVMNFPRAVMASTDFSAPLRQGLGLIHKKQFWTSLDDMFKAWGSEKAFREIQSSIADKPLFKPRTTQGKSLPSFADESGLKLTDLTDLSNREEALMSTWAEKIPGIRRSNRAYTAFLNKLRADTFESLVQNGKVLGTETNLPLAKELANFVNTATGRGSLPGSLEKSAVMLNSTFFAPRLIASRLQMLNPAYYIMADPMVRKEALKSLFSIAAAGNIVTQLGKMAGGTIEKDPVSSDFGKLKIGNTRLDPFGGFQQYIVAANRLVQGRSKSTVTGNEYNLGEKFGRPTRLDVVGRFAESKLNPVLSLATAILRGKDFTGNKTNIPEEVVSRFTPIFIQDLKQLATENPNLIPGIHDDPSYGEFHPENLPFAIPSAFGMSVQNYESR